MAYLCNNRCAAVLWSIMLVILCFCLFVYLGAVEPWPQRQRQGQWDQSKELLLVHAVIIYFPKDFQFS